MRRRLFVLLPLLILLGIWDMVSQPRAGWGVRPAPSVLINPAELEKHVRVLSVDLAPRDVSHPDNLAKTAVYISDAFQKAGGRLSAQMYTAQKQRYRNVIASFGPITGERIIVGAHYDACGPHPAADDNGSGVAALIELAHALRKVPLNKRVDLVAWTLEEPPFYSTYHMGSAVHARMLKNEKINVRAVLSIESIGFFSDAARSQTYPNPLLYLAYPRRANFIAVVGRLEDRALVAQIKSGMKKGSSVPVYSINAPASIEGVDYSDHRSYWAQGYPAAMVTDTAFCRNANYHRAGDTADTLDYPRMAQVVSGLYETVVDLAK